jgi:phosphopantothenate---cysteine ligase (CTP)
MKAIVTCGPAFEPIDEVRRITTGELGVVLAGALAPAGHEVTLLQGEGATFHGATPHAAIRRFTTNDDLLEQLRTLAQGGGVGAVFHAAALCDYRVRKVRDTDGGVVAAAKIPSRAGALTLELEPATKVIGELRGLFPDAVLVGWKFELVGARDEALAKGWQQIRDNRTDACVVNGRAYGEGFGVCVPPTDVHRVDGKSALADWLAAWIGKRG